MTFFAAACPGSFFAGAVLRLGRTDRPRPDNPPNLTCQTPAGVAFQVTDEGLSEIRFGQKVLARGGWSVFNAEPWFKDGGTGRVAAGKIVEKSIEVLDPQHARVRHVKQDVVCTTDYAFDGEDVLISARVANRHAEAAPEHRRFQWPGVLLRPAADGPDDDPAYQLLPGPRRGHCAIRSFWSKIGGSYAVDGTIGVGLSPWRTGWNRTLLLWDYTIGTPTSARSCPSGG